GEVAQHRGMRSRDPAEQDLAVGLQRDAVAEPAALGTGTVDADAAGREAGVGAAVAREPREHERLDGSTARRRYPGVSADDDLSVGLDGDVLRDRGAWRRDHDAASGAEARIERAVGQKTDDARPLDRAVERSADEHDAAVRLDGDRDGGLVRGR